MLLSKDQMLGAGDLRHVRVAVPEWGGDVLVGTITADERDDFEAKVMAGARARAWLVAMTVIDPTGARLFAPEDVPKLGRKSGAAVGRIFAAAMKLNALRSRDIEDLEKNSDAGQAGGSSSASPATSGGPSTSSAG